MIPPEPLKRHLELRAPTFVDYAGMLKAVHTLLEKL